MAKIHRSDAPLPQAPSVQVKASYTVTDLPKVSPQEPAAFYDQDNDEDYRRRETAKCKKKRGNLLYTSVPSCRKPSGNPVPEWRFRCLWQPVLVLP